MDKLNFAIIGCGRIAPRHAEAITRNEKANLVAVCDIIEERAQEFVSRYGASRYYTDYRQLLERPDIDVVDVCTPSGLHAQMGIDAARARKHVVMEKPMAMSLEDADTLIRSGKENGVLLTVCHQNRFNPAVQKLRQALEEGRFGKLTHGSAVIRWFRPQDYYEQAKWRGTWAMDGGCLMNQSIHNIDLLLWMMGPVESIFGYTARQLRNIEAEDVGVAVLKFRSGALGVIESSVTVYPRNLEETLNIFGEKGTVVLGGEAVNRIEEWRFADRPDETAQSLAQQNQEVPTIYGFGHDTLIEDFIQSIRNKKRPYIDGEEGRRALEAILAIYSSTKNNRQVSAPFNKNIG
ncbi:MAG: Gfo/Idh/MocA family oxidoreductase [Firmicutes bacterium]|nr:Gfo/Idh/MocA family oxidoreductase [Bacillota bacterium]